MKKVLTKVFGDPQVRTVKRLTKRVAAINDLAKKYKSMTDSELKKQTVVLKERLANKKTTLEDILPDAFALVREAADRKVGMRHFDVQLVGGMALHEGNVAEMKTGEGKTLVATLPTYLNALTEKGVHIVTVNDYLAQRDAGWMGEVYHALGLSTGIIIAERSFLFDPKFDNPEHEDPRMRKLRPCTRKEAYGADVTYGTNNEFGFDYLRDNMVNDVELLRQRELHFAIVDEVDSILIDEARTPLIISAPAAESPELYQKFSKIAAKLTPEDYILDEKRKSVSLSEQGVDKVQKMLGVNNLYSPEHVRSVYHMDQALRAETLFRKDKEYVISNDNEIIIVDEFTGRLMHGRRYNEGLHQAIEAKENVPVLQESMTLATISFQNYFRLYEKLSGMTGTAFTEAEEFQQIYSLDVVQIPSNKPMIREDKMDMIFKTEAGKLKALVRDVAEHRNAGRPVLIGSASITKNELISRELTKAGITHEILNAKNNEHEASIIAKAGQKGAVTLATNIAGRGTDIVLGEGVRELGGLVVLGSERHEARRIDNQLRGRGGRQGDPGISQFYVSTEDDLMRIFQGERIASLMDRLGVEEDMPIQNRSVSKTLEAAQKRVEGYHYDARKNVVQYDNVINRHRKAVYHIRRQILESEDNKAEIEKLVSDKVEDLASTALDAQLEFKEQLETVFHLDQKTIKKLADEKKESVRRSALTKAANKRYKEQEEALTPDVMRKIEREVYLQVLDTLWMQHLENMQHLREGIHWRSVGQRDPLVEYRRESQHLFDSMQLTLRDEIVQTVFSVTRADITPAAIDESFDTELTRAAEKSVEQGVNEVTMTSQSAEFTPKRSATSPKKTKSTVQKNRKKQRKNKKKARRH
jgi:preprotein translocase subunit SecA